MKSQNRAGHGVPPAPPQISPPRRSSRRGRALPPLGLAIVGLLVILGCGGGGNAGTLIFPAVLIAAAVWLAHSLSRE